MCCPGERFKMFGGVPILKWHQADLDPAFVAALHGV